MAPPPPPGTQAPPVWTSLSLVPAVLLGILSVVVVLCSVVVVLWLAQRKGRSRWFALLAFVPCVGWVVVFYLLALTDKRVLDDVAALKRQIGAQDGDDAKP
jgi:hypothetical protein